tara:strand:- start:98 stop:667 length:570 start_codon:yes stop_codon:yes gene_type:complete
MKIRLIQSNCSSLNSIFIFEDFLEDLNYLNLLKTKIEKFTSKDNRLDYVTNVKAKMTEWTTLLDDNDFGKFHQSVGETLYNVINLRNPTCNEKLKVQFIDSWGMRHTEGNFTKDHIHSFCTYSGGFYFDVPSPTEMWFEDFQEGINLKNNMLVLFPALCKHRVSIHRGEKHRISMAFNMVVANLDAPWA